MYTPIPLARVEKVRGYWEGYSPKLKRDVYFSSDLENDHWLLIETDPSVETFCERPFKAEKIMNGKRSESILSMWVQHKDKSEQLIKVRYENIRSPILSKKIENEMQIEKEWCEIHSHNYLVKTEEILRNNTLLLSNKKLLISFICNRSKPIDMDYHLIKKYIAKKKSSLNEIQLHFVNVILPSRISEAISWMVYRGEIQSNMDKVPFGSKLEVWVRDETESNRE